MTAVDADLAAEITSWGALSIKKTELAIDALVERHDPGALRRSQASASNRKVQFGSPADAPGLTSLWARLHSADAAIGEKNVQDLAYSVCERDPRSGPRRPDQRERRRQRRGRRSRRAGRAGRNSLARHQTTRRLSTRPTDDTVCCSHRACVRSGLSGSGGVRVRRRDRARPVADPAPGRCPDPPHHSPRPHRPREPLHPLTRARRVPPLPRPDMPLPRLRQTRH
ncbi:MAG: DUF222 domain-containing protein [Mycobacterium sp.]